MQRLSVKPTLRGWWDYLIQRKYGEIYQCGIVDMYWAWIDDSSNSVAFVFRVDHF